MIIGSCGGGGNWVLVPKGKARIHTQISAAHTKEDLDKAIEAFVKTCKELHSKLRPKK